MAGTQFSSVQFSHSVMSDSLQPHELQHARPLSITNSQSPLKLMSIESVMPSNHLILCRHLLLLPSILPSIRVFSNESALCITWPKYWSFSFNINSNAAKTLLEIQTHVAGTQTQPNPQYLVSGPNEGQVLDVSSQKEFSDDKVIGKNWIYSDSERSTFHRQSVGHGRGPVWP